MFTALGSMQARDCGEFVHSRARVCVRVPSVCQWVFMAVHLVHLAGVMRASSNVREIAVSVPLSLWRRVASEVFDLYFSFEIITFCDCSSPSLSHSRSSIPLACSLLVFLFSFFF